MTAPVAGSGFWPAWIARVANPCSRSATRSRRHLPRTLIHLSRAVHVALAVPHDSQLVPRAVEQRVGVDRLMERPLGVVDPVQLVEADPQVVAATRRIALQDDRLLELAHGTRVESLLALQDSHLEMGVAALGIETHRLLESLLGVRERAGARVDATELDRHRGRSRAARQRPTEKGHRLRGRSE